MTMEVRVCIYLGALLLLHVGSADHGNEHTAQPAPERDLDLTSNLPPIIAPKSSNATSSTGNNTTTHWEVAVATPQPSQGKTTSIPQRSVNLTDVMTSKPSVTPTFIIQASDATSPHSPSKKTQANTNSHQPPDSLPVSTTLLSRAAAVSTPLSRTTSDKTPTTTQRYLTPTIARQHSTPTPTTACQRTTPTPITTQQYTTPTTTRFTTTSSRETSTSQMTTLMSAQRTSSKAPVHTTVDLSSLTSTQTKLHADTPSQLNVKGNTVHDSPTLDPLLAGLVSAFIVSAAVITLLLFLKLRRRDNRPEFRRLQDLPMDDMMEETPLSMYSY
ncbi:integumentary mucin C.1-like [Hippocampus zosterae]|uniref:integumentary mucin C.1-like n=1 Tax=Hippocampus zosterae TaxID=109293 RepID=UPI00223D1969|nr:integumentary mucin C.1-like [Hippocampus zosterae]